MPRLLLIVVVALGLLVGGLVLNVYLKKAAVERSIAAVDTARQEQEKSARAQEASAKRGAESAAIAEVKTLLKDPLSAQIAVQKVLLNRVPPPGGGDIVCGTVNAKNSYGGYTGERLFFVQTLLLNSGQRQTFATVLTDDDHRCLTKAGDCFRADGAREWTEYCTAN